MVVLQLASLFFVFHSAFYGKVEADEPKWESAIATFERDDQQTNYPSNAILFVGSSSIRLWDTLAVDMDPHPVIQRGFGGAKMIDVLRYIDRILGRHQPPAIVLFVANDIIGNKSTDLTPTDAAKQFIQFTDRVLKRLPTTEVFIVAVTPTPRRWTVWPQAKELNSLIAERCNCLERATFIPTEAMFIGPEGTPQPELYRADKLHLSPLGYCAWTKQIRRFLDQVIPMTPH